MRTAGRPGSTQEFAIRVQGEKKRAAEEGNRVPDSGLRRPVDDVPRIFIDGHVALRVSPLQQQIVAKLQLLLTHSRVGTMVIDHFAPALFERTHGNGRIFGGLRLFLL